MAKIKNDRNETLPSEKKKNSVIEKINEWKETLIDKELTTDAVFSEPLTPAPKVDETRPLKKGSIDMWFLLWAMILVCFGLVMSYSASAVQAEQIEGESATY